MNLTLRAENGAASAAEGELVRYSDAQRIGRSVALGASGFVGAAMCIVIPGVHLITTWLLPLLALIGARQLLHTRERLRGLRGKCPSCQAAIELEGGRVQRPMIEPCPACHRNLRIELPEDQSSRSPSASASSSA